MAGGLVGGLRWGDDGEDSGSEVARDRAGDFSLTLALSRWEREPRSERPGGVDGWEDGDTSNRECGVVVGREAGILRKKKTPGRFGLPGVAEAGKGQTL